MTRLLAFALLAACGSSVTSAPDAPTPPADAALTAAQACATSAAARCAKLQACSPADLQRRFGTLAVCEARDTLGCTEALAAPMTGQTPTKVLACSDAVTAESCPDFFSKAPPAACTTPVGTDTGACGFAAECTTGFCGIATDAQCGTCAPQPLVGDSCATLGCGQTLVCVASTMTCQTPVASGGSCSRDLPCEAGFACVGTTAQPPVNGICMAEVATAGATCDAKRKTGPDCSGDAGLTCDGTTNVCVAQPLAAAGASCGLVAGVVTRCTAGATCVLPTGSTMGTCVAPAADGAACDPATGPTCLTPARCIPTTAGGTAGTCMLPGATCP